MVMGHYWLSSILEVHCNCCEVNMICFWNFHPTVGNGPFRGYKLILHYSLSSILEAHCNCCWATVLGPSEEGAGSWSEIAWGESGESEDGDFWKGESLLRGKKIPFITSQIFKNKRAWHLGCAFIITSVCVASGYVQFLHIFMHKNKCLKPTKFYGLTTILQPTSNYLQGSSSGVNGNF